MNSLMTKDALDKVDELRDTISQPESSCQPKDYRMIDSVNIQNFRCFESVKLTDCPRVNIIVGRNASGKTALLEALFIASGSSPEVALRVKAWRGEASISSPSGDVHEALWKDLFFNFDLSRKIHIDLRESSGAFRSLDIQYDVQTSTIDVPIKKV